MTARREGEGMPRTVHVAEATTGRSIGEIAHGWLFLHDERDRDAVLAHLDEQGVAVAHPTTPHRSSRHRDWSAT